MAEQIVEFRPRTVAVSRAGAVAEVRAAVDAMVAHTSSAGFVHPEYLGGDQALAELATVESDVVLNGITGAAGLPATLAALRAGRVLALANKESLIMGGELVKREAAPGQLVPVDSEHSALAQALRSGRHSEVKRLVVTATGGPFRGMKREELKHVTVEQALDHPKWSMGPVISINSATMANKGLEIIEANLLFDIGYDKILVVVHPQAYIHSMVEFHDGSTIAQVNPPDLRLPIALGLKWPDRMADVVPGVDWTLAHTWELSPLDEDLGPMVSLAFTAGRLAGAAPAVYNAANEVCVDAFRNSRIPFLAIHEVVEAVISEYEPPHERLTLESLMEYDTTARRQAGQVIAQRFG
ncbi:1-deoxy-D-xylulose-5-phosphate reductoisomerase [Kitasatospora sp. NPDC092948]|uniref:1-deoxy-D-xylulose-5-phosphate reductoisomerase n=1 Tax=Kitasatospora sp. NPDC092948 TaxID=3364088 RepID=UPI00382921B6